MPATIRSTTPSVRHRPTLPLRDAMIRDYLVAAALQQTELVCYYLEVEKLHPDTTRNGKPTAVCYAALKGDPRLVAYLLDKGADPNLADALGMTSLHYAALGGCEHCVAALIDRGADIHARNYRGHTPLALTENQPRLALCGELLARRFH